jgi:hypothetical protein
MSKNSLGELKLSPIKENGRFVFINNEIRVNGKLNKGDCIKIYVDGYEMRDGIYRLNNTAQPTSKLVVRGLPLQHMHPETYETVDDLYNEASQIYKNQFYFGKTTI